MNALAPTRILLSIPSARVKASYSRAFSALSAALIVVTLSLTSLTVASADAVWPNESSFAGLPLHHVVERLSRPDSSSQRPGLPAGATLPSDTAWELVFSDEFDGESLDSNNWVTCFWWGSNGGCEAEHTPLTWYQPQNVAVRDGTLKLVATNVPFTTPDGKTYPYTSGMITTAKLYSDTFPNKFTFTYGYMEMRAKLPRGQGMWPAFWSIPPEGKWPPEIDVMEFLGHEANIVHMGYHYLDGQGVHQVIVGPWAGPDFTTDWHLFAVDWRPDAIVWYIDGVERQRYEGPYIADEPMYLIANLQVGGSWPGNPDPTTPFPSTYEIDYIRVYQPIGISATTFADVPSDHPYHDEIEALYQAGYTVGCNADPLMYCPEQTMNRAEAAVFVERGIRGTDFNPPAPSSQVFADLASGSWAAKWVYALWNDQYTAGCGTNPLVYCPWQGHSRAEGAVFYLRMLHGANYEPPQPMQQAFSDVPLDAWYARWIQAAYDSALISPCQTTPDLRFCPEDPLSRATAAYMMVKAKGLIPTHRIEFGPSSEDFANPERGFMRWTELWPEGTDWPWGLSHPANPADTLVWLNIRLDNYRTRPLDDAALARIGAAFDVARNAGLKVVARFMYNAGSDGPWSPDPSTWAPDAALDQVLEHIGQLKPLLASHTDILNVLQAGFVGHWGEWHSSTNNLTSPASQKVILGALAQALPADRMLQVRTPAIKKGSFGGPLPETDAFTGTAAARIGHHNDCFLASDDDAGTYTSDSDGGSSAEAIAYWKDFVAKEGRFTPVGGETCDENPPRSLCPTALNELEMLHWSFINNSYNQAVLDSWVAGGCMDAIRLRLGYRLVLTEAVLPQSVRAGSSFELQFRLRNEGFAAMYNPRPVFAVLDGPGGRYEMLLENVDPRRWASGTVQTITTRLRLPSSIPEGIYRLSLWLPDQADSLRSDPRYAVRFANAEVWEASSGLNVLTTDFTVTVEATALLDPAP